VADAPLIDIRDVVKPYGTPQPLRIRSLQVERDAALVLRGLDAHGAEMFVNLLTGAALPEEGTVLIEGRDTRAITTDTEWLASLDRFGLVTLRAVLIGALPIAQNLALPMTLAIDPMAPDVRADVESLADSVGLAHSRLDEPAHSLTPAETVRVHLARALAVRPSLLLLEHPTSSVTTPAESAAIGSLVSEVARRRGLGWLALSNDDVFVGATGAQVATLDVVTGLVKTSRSWWSRLIPRSRPQP
jgi:ABC-type transporter Mla maintaining outer membrane lipid asymmetry ATPase subunit MlaF